MPPGGECIWRRVSQVRQKKRRQAPVEPGPGRKKSGVPFFKSTPDLVIEILAPIRTGSELQIALGAREIEIRRPASKSQRPPRKSVTALRQSLHAWKGWN